jgi:hypothetical protein
MTVTLKRWHWTLFVVLSVAELGGYILLSRSSMVIFAADFLQRAGWVTRFLIPVGSAIRVAFTATVTIAQLTDVFVKQK